jgi:uncharacterized membrane protein YgcG
MASLITSTRWLAALSLVVLVPCEAQAKSATGLAYVYVYDQPVACSAAQNICHGPVPEAVQSVAFLSTDAGSSSPGMYVSFELRRGSGVVGRVEVDVPTGAQGVPRVSYSEHLDGQLVFSATRARGAIQLPPQQLDLSASTCTCTDGRLELLLVDAGPDGKLDTPDDLVRRISQARFAWSATTFCLGSRVLDVPEGIEVGPVDQCPTPTTSGSGSGSGGSSYGGGGGGGSGGGGSVEVDIWDVDYGDGGCGGDESDYEAEGCEGDSGGDDYSAEGCEGDSGSWDGGGCEGDTGGDCAGGGGDFDLGGGDCGGGGGGECAVGPRSRGGWFAQALDAGGGRSRCPLRRARHAIPTLPLVLAGLLLLHLATRARGGRARP